MRVAFIVASLFGALQQGCAVSLRATPSANKTAPNASQAEASSTAIDDAMSMVGAMQNQLNKPKPTTHAPGNASHRAKLDLGFTGYEANLTQQLTASMRKVTPAPQWTDELRNQLIANVTASVSQSLKDNLKAVKQSVGKTWMALPEDEQKDLYVNQVKLKFEPVFADSLTNMMRHFDIAATRVSKYAAQRTPLAPKELLVTSEKALTDNILTERCYTKDMFLQLVLVDSDMEADEVASPNVSKPAGAAKLVGAAKHLQKGDKFCMASVVSKLAGRLNDAQGMISMTMRFDAGAMDMLQRNKKALKK